MKTKDKIKAHQDYDQSGRQEKINVKEKVAKKEMIQIPIESDHIRFIIWETDKNDCKQIVELLECPFQNTEKNRKLMKSNLKILQENKEFTYTLVEEQLFDHE